MEFAVRYEDPLVEVGGLKADSVLSKTCTWVEMKSMGQELDENKISFKNNGSLLFNSRKGVVTSTDIAKLCDNGDATSEVLEANIVNKCKNSLKRLPNEIYEEYIVSLDPKRYKNGLPRSPDGEFVNIVDDSEGGNMRDDDVMLDPEVFAEEVCQPSRNN